ncbi:NADH-quinone oxidoreductase subunit B family protein [Sulfurimonas sp.]
MHSRHVLKTSVLWIQGVTCNANTHSFLNLEYLPELLERIEFLSHPLLPSLFTLKELSESKKKCDIVIFEGAYDPDLIREDKSIHDLLLQYAYEAHYVIALGTCASFGGIFKEVSPKKNSGLVFNVDDVSGPLVFMKNRVINISGCPIHPEWIGSTLNLILDELQIPLDDKQRPQELYSSLAHHGCSRNEYFEWKVDAEGFGLKEGCLFYKQGCRGPMTHASCNKILWNEVNSKTRAGTPCFGCTESDFPRSNLFETKTNMSIPQETPLGVAKRPYLTITGIAKTFHIKRLEEKLIDYQKDN